MSLSRSFDRRRLHARVLTLVGLGAFIPVLLLIWVNRTGHKALEKSVLSEREQLARSVATHVDEVVGSELRALQGLQTVTGFDLPDGDPAPVLAALREVYQRRHVLFDEVFIFDRRGKLIGAEPGTGYSPWGLGVVEKALENGRLTMTPLVTTPDGERRLLGLVPLRSWQGEIVAVAVGAIDPNGPHLAVMLNRHGLGEAESVDLIDAEGRVVATTDRERLFLESDHAQFLANLIAERRTAARACHSCHERQSRAPVAELMAFAPLQLAPWGVSVRQPEREALANAGGMGRSALALAAASLLIALTFAWGAARSVTQPLAVLTASAERIAEGQLAEPIPELGEDEVGRLGRSLEEMRKTLQFSVEMLEQSNEDLEERVSDRTRELERLNEQLKEREQARQQLLQKVITAQEDERKRIARELHDETTQSLAALVMGMEGTVAACEPGDVRRRLMESKGLAVRTLEEVHRLIVDLRPSVLDDLGLNSAITWYADRTLKPRGVSVRVESEGLEKRLPPQMEIAMFRAVQETLTNIAKHAEAESVLVQCNSDGRTLRIEIEDDGKGFDPAALAAPQQGRGWGLLGIRERVELFGGKVEFDSAPGQGTRVVMTVPLPNGEEQA